MTIPELLSDTNLRMWKGETFSDDEKSAVRRTLLAAASGQDTAARFHTGVRASGDGRMMYPRFFIPPYNGGKKIRMITGQLPKTQILSANHYELEILRILARWDGDNPQVQFMVNETLKRLDATCFAHFCATGECVGAGVCVLRFLTALSPRDGKWIDELLLPLVQLYRNGPKGMAAASNHLPVFYLYAVLPDIAGETAIQLVEDKKEWIIHMLTRGCLTGPAIQDTYGVAILYILRNALAMLPEYSYMKDREVTVSGKDNRCYCDAE